MNRSDGLSRGGRERDARSFAPLVWFALAAYLVALLLTFAPNWWPVSFAVLAVALLRRPIVLVGAFAVLLTAWSVGVHGATLAAIDPGLFGESHRIELQLTSSATPLASSFGFVAQTDRAHASAELVAIDGVAIARAPVSVIGALGEHPAWADRLVVTGELLPNQPGEPLGILLMSRDVESSTPASGPLFVAERMRSALRDASANLNGVAAQLVPGFAIGDTSRVSTELSTAMKTASLTHLMAVSGANCALIVAGAWAICAALRLSKRWRIVCSALALGGFVLLVTPQPSVIRAAVMALIALVSLVRGRPMAGLSALAAAVLVLLWLDPWLAWNAGFALSVAASAGLLVLSSPLAAKLRPRFGGFAEALAIPLAAQLACTPILVLLSPSIALWGVPANLVAGWFAPVATLLGVLASLLLVPFPWLGTILVWCAAVPSAIIGHIALAVAAFPAARIPWLAGLFGALTVAALTVAVLWVWFRGRRRARRAALAMVLVAVAFAAGLWGIGAVIHSWQRPSNWVIAGCDVGQGDAFVIRDGGQVALIDTGRSPPLIRDCLSQLGIDRLNLLVLTHYDQDHVGGSSALLGRVDRVLVGPIGDQSDQALRDEFARGGAEVLPVHRGDSGMLGAARFTVLWPTNDHESGNPASVTISIELAGLTALFLGDLGEEAQDALLRAGAPHDIDVVKVAHHGSKDQSARLYQQLQARLGLIGVGSNDYGHPTATLLSMLDQSHTTVARTDQQGLLLVAPAGQHDLQLWTSRGGSG